MKLYRHQLTVRGKGHFPVDMLRRDQCWPLTTADAIEVTEPVDNNPRCVIVEKLSQSDDPGTAWTLRRWESFGWEIVSNDCSPATAVL